MKILIVKLGSIGDVVHAMPGVARLRRALPDARIDWLVERYARGILKYAKNINQVIEIDTLRWRRSFFKPATLREMIGVARRLRSERYDAVLELQGLWKSALMASLAGAKHVVGADRRFLREPHSSIFYSRRLDREARRENVIFEHIRVADGFLATVPSGTKQVALDPAGPNGIEFDDLASETDRAWVSAQLEPRGFDRFAIIHPGANWKSKLWPLEKYASLARRIQQELRLALLVTMGPSEKALSEEMSRLFKADRTMLLSPSLSQLAALSERATVFIGPDTGPLHIAAASGAPIVGIFAPTDPVRNGPFRPLDKVVHRNLCGKFCNRRDCGPRKCITTISVDEVFDAVKERVRGVTADSRELTKDLAGA